jgi:hypothetical protein
MLPSKSILDEKQSIKPNSGFYEGLYLYNKSLVNFQYYKLNEK